MSAEGEMRSLTVLGATGSIGDSTLEIVRRNPDKYKVHAITAGKNLKKLALLVNEFRPNYAVIADESCYSDLKDLLGRHETVLLSGADALDEVASHNVDRVVAGITGAAGLSSIDAAVRAGHTIALANKESLVCAGDYLVSLASQTGAQFLPIDSEHNAIYQVFDFDRADRVRRIILTASGGPFLETSLDQFSSITPAQAVAHPNWDMGAKISVDSATMMNKGLEMIEAYHLFPIKPQQIDIVIHPQSVIHSMVDYVDGSVLAQMGHPDMRTPISYCLAWPDRQELDLPALDFAALSRMDFFAPDYQRYPCLKLAAEALEKGDSAPLVLNAANEIAVQAFLDGKLPFTKIAGLVEKCLGQADMKRPQSLENILCADQEVRQMARALIA